MNNCLKIIVFAGLLTLASVVAPTSAHAETLLEKGIALYKSGERQKAANVLEQACRKKVDNACMVLAGLYLNEGKWKAAMDPLERACKGGQRTACAALGERFTLGPDSARDLDRGISFLKKACDTPRAKMCSQTEKIALSLIRGGFGPDVDRAGLSKRLGLLEHTCKFGLIRSCEKFAGARRALEAMKHLDASNYAKAGPMLEQTCEDASVGCFKLAALHLGGRGVAKSLDKARDAYETGCEQEDIVQSCVKTADMYARGDGGDYPGSYDADDTRHFKEAVRDEKGLERRYARDFYRRACKAGNEYACGKWKALR